MPGSVLELASESIHSSLREESVIEHNEQDDLLAHFWKEPETATSEDMPKVEKALHALLRKALELGLSEEHLRKLRYKLIKPTVHLAVLALMKAGKSTLLNALMHEEFLPSASLPATASITHIQHRPDVPQGRLTLDSPDEAGHVYEGRDEIHLKIKNINEERRADVRASQIQMLLEAPIPSFGDLEENADVILVDTPGPNEHGAGLEAEVLTVLQKADVIFYVLDFTKLGSDDEAKMFETLKQSVVPLLQSTGSNVQRMYYVLNKVDMHQKRNDKRMECIQADIAKKIQGMLPMGATVKPTDILPISASSALLARQVKRRCKDKDFLHDFLKTAMGVCFEDEIDEDEWEAKALEKAKGLEKRSCLIKMEAEVVAKVVAQKRMINVLSVLDMLKIQLEKLFNDTKLKSACMNSTIDELQSAMKAMELTREDIKERLGQLNSLCEQKQAETLEEAGQFFDRLQKEISVTIDTCFSSGSTDSEQSNTGYIKPFMRLIRWLACDVDQLEATSKEQLRDKLAEANHKVNELLELKMMHFKSDIQESMARQRQALRSVLVDTVQPLLKMVTDNGGKAFKMEFKEEHLALPDIDLEGFQNEMNAKMQQMVKEKREQVTKTRQEHVEKHGACGARWTESHDVEYQEEATTGFKVDKMSLKACWQARINDLIGVSQRSTQLLIKQEIIGEVKKVQVEVQSRCDDFIRTIQLQVEQQETQTSEYSNSKQELEATLAKLEDTLNGTVYLKATVSTIDDSGDILGFRLIESERAEPKNGKSPA